MVANVARTAPPTNAAGSAKLAHQSLASTDKLRSVGMLALPPRSTVDRTNLVMNDATGVVVVAAAVAVVVIMDRDVDVVERDAKVDGDCGVHRKVVAGPTNGETLVVVVGNVKASPEGLIIKAARPRQPTSRSTMVICVVCVCLSGKGSMMAS